MPPAGVYGRELSGIHFPRRTETPRADLDIIARGLARPHGAAAPGCHITSPPPGAATIAEPASGASSAASPAAINATAARTRNAAANGPPPVLATPTR